jgi:putative tryptophan/tyrosine transport system substrate-binding protein
MPVIGFLDATTAADTVYRVSAFREGLKEAGFIDGHNVAIEFRWAENKFDRLPALAADLAQRQVAVIIGPNIIMRAARAATSTIPIVFVSGADPIASGLVTNLSRPGGNITGVTQLTSMLGAKRIGLLRELVPKADPIAVLINPNFPVSPAQLKDAQAAAAAIGVRIVVLQASAESEFEPAFAALVANRAGALMVAADPFFNSRRTQLVALAALHRVPAIYEFREFAAAGGLMSYGTSLADAYFQVGNYTGRILKGARAAELPIVQSSRFEFVINMKTAKALGLDVPLGLSAGADEVIE